jgi:hypothetical protein
MSRTKRKIKDRNNLTLPEKKEGQHQCQVEGPKDISMMNGVT